MSSEKSLWETIDDRYADTTVVQALHLFTNWLINGGGAVNSNQATWTVIGMAMRTVQILGLHRDGQVFDLSQEELTERRRVFWEVSRAMQAETDQ